MFPHCFSFQINLFADVTQHTPQSAVFFLQVCSFPSVWFNTKTIGHMHIQALPRIFPLLHSTLIPLLQLTATQKTAGGNQDLDPANQSF